MLAITKCNSPTIYSVNVILPGNEEVLKKIDGGVFVLALDDTTSEDHKELSLGFLHGDGSNRSPYDFAKNLPYIPNNSMCYRVWLICTN